MDVKQISKLANLPISSAEELKFSADFSDTLKTIDVINQLDTSGVLPTSQVTGLTNVTRDDVVDTSRLLSQEQAISQAPASYNGFVVVPSVFHEE